MNEQYSPEQVKYNKPRIFQRRYEAIEEIKGPLVFLKPLHSTKYGEILEIIEDNGRRLRAQVIDASEKIVVAQVFEGTYHLQREKTMTIQSGEIFKMAISDAMVGIPLNGLGEPKDPNIKLSPIKYIDVTSNPINPAGRDVPKNPIETGIAGIDGLNTLVQGQKLPIFSGPGLPSSEVAIRIAKHVASQRENLYVVFAAMGITQREGNRYIDELGKAAGADKIAYFLNFVEDPTVERILTPKCALTFAEYLAFTKGFDVLVILSDMLSYAQALREIASAREEIPGRRGYPGYLYTDMARIYERAGRIIGQPGTLTQIPVVTMPNNDITHPVPDLTGYSTEGQIVLSNEIHYKGIFPPIDVSPSLSRLMNSGIGEGFTRSDHKHVANQLYAAYSEGRRVRELTQITGKDSLNQLDRLYLQFADTFEKEFVGSGELTFVETLDLGWKLLRDLPRDELIRIPTDVLDEYYPIETEE